MADSVWDIVAANESGRAIGAPGRAWMDGAGLAAQCAEVRASLNAAGIGRGDRVAIVMPNGPEMAACFVAVAACCTAAPLNPAYKQDEFDFYLGDLKPTALIVMDDDEGAACTAAARLGIPVIGLVPEEGPAGGFTLDASRVPPRQAAQPGPAQPGDIALILHTSGTTARPKIVPLTGANLAASARHIADALVLAPADTCLNVMPLFHIHGLIAGRAVVVERGGCGQLHAGVQRVQGCGVADRGSAKLVYGGADDAPGHSDADARPAGAGAGGRAAIHPVQLRLVAAAGDGGAGGRVRIAGCRSVRHDRGGAPDGVQPAAAADAQAGFGGGGGGARDRGHGRGRRRPAAGQRGRGGHPRAERDAGVRRECRGQREGLHRRVVPHRGPGAGGRGRVPVPDGAA